MNKTTKTRLPLVAVGIAISTFTVIAAEPTVTTAGSKARPNAAEVGKGAPPAWVVTSPETVKRAEAGDADAMFEIANGYMELAVSPRINADDKEREALRQEAMKWTQRRAKVMADREGDLASIRKRAEAGDAAAQRNLGFRYSQGIDVEKDEKKSFEWTKKAAEQGDARAMFNLANKYALGNGTGKNADEAVEWFRKVAEQGHVGAQAYWGYCLLQGQGVKKDEKSAAEWLRKAAEKGNSEAQLNYGRCLFYGEVVEKDQAFAAAWYRSAAEQGVLSAMYNLGLCYLLGTGTVRDKKRLWRGLKKQPSMDTVAR